MKNLYNDNDSSSVYNVLSEVIFDIYINFLVDRYAFPKLWRPIVSVIGTFRNVSIDFFIDGVYCSVLRTCVKFFSGCRISKKKVRPPNIYFVRDKYNVPRTFFFFLYSHPRR